MFETRQDLTLNYGWDQEKTKSDGVLFMVGGHGALRQSTPRQCAPRQCAQDNPPRRQYAPRQSTLETSCPGDNPPRFKNTLLVLEFPPETTCPGRQETTCPRDNPPRIQHAPRQCTPETSCPGDNPSRFQNTLLVLDYVRLG